MTDQLTSNTINTFSFYSFIKTNIRNLFKAYAKFCDGFEKYLPVTVVGGFVGGILLAKAIPAVGDGVSAGMDTFVEFYGLLAPLVIFIILAPSLARMSSTKQGTGGNFISYAFSWLSFARFLSLIWAVLFTWIAFGLPFTGGDTDFLTSVKETFGSLVWMATHSVYFYAMYLSVAALFVARKFKAFENFLRKMLNGVEDMGQFFIPIIPLFMAAIGSYVYQLPSQMDSQLGEATDVAMQPLSILGMSFETNSAMGMVIVYGMISLTIGVACFMFHMGIVFVAKMKERRFSIKEYFTKYWIGVYPLLWATSSEALATPLNMYLVKRHYPWVYSRVRQFTVGAGSYLGINGTMICVIVLAAAVANILNIEITATQLFMCIPLVFLIGFGVPGIPGELLLFGGPIVELLGFPIEVGAMFLTVYLGLQIGLPDSFRTGSNSTDNCVMAVLFNKGYKEKYLDEELLVGELLRDQHFKQAFSTRFKVRLGTLGEIPTAPPAAPPTVPSAA